MEILNPELHLAEQFVQQTNCTVFLTGKAGTGKTTFLHAIRRQTDKRLVVTAPTGVAAINAGGVTLHSFFQLPFGPFVPGSELHLSQHRMSREKRNLIRSMDVLVIDEISMVRADLLDGVDAVLRRYRRSEQPFGGVQLLMIGDLHQLAPVAKEQEWQLLAAHYASPYFFSSQALRGVELITIELVHIYRQSDPRFIGLLNRVRDNRLDPASLAELNSRYRPDFSPDQAEGCITLCTHNAQADAINQRRLAALPGPSRWFAAGLEGTFPEYAYPTAASLELKPGAQVMFVRNDTSPEKRWYNGKIGTISQIAGSSVLIDCPGEAAPIEAAPVTWENIEYTVDPETSEISPKVVGSFSQYPLKPAWAITIHKSQGLTFDRAVIDAQAAFAPGQVYVALSRCRTFEGLVLSSPLGLRTVLTDPAVLEFAAETERRKPTAATLHSAKIRYQQLLLLQCYDCTALARLFGRLVGLIRGNAAIVQVAAASDLFDAQRLTLEQICTVGDNFRRQLQSLFRPDQEPAEDPVVTERLAKAAGYFRDKFAALLTPCLEGLTIESDNKEIRKRLNEAAKRLAEETAIRLAGILACGDGFTPGRYLRALSAAALEPAARPAKAETAYSEADVGHPELFASLRNWRSDRARAENLPPFQVLHQKTLVQIAVRLPDSLTELTAIKGIGKRLAQRYGDEIVALVSAYRARHGIDQVELPNPASITPLGERKKPGGKKEDTKRISLEMLEQGLSAAEIAAERGLTPQTVEGHLAFYVKKGDLAVDRVLSREQMRDLDHRISELRALSLKEIRSALGGEYSYGEINLFLAHLLHRESL